jgi:hypothetical protein
LPFARGGWDYHKRKPSMNHPNQSMMSDESQKEKDANPGQDLKEKKEMQMAGVSNNRRI